MGYRRIPGEPARLGHRIAASTMWKILRDAGIDPNCDQELQDAIRTTLRRHTDEPASESATVSHSIARFKSKRSKLLDLHYADKISADAFHEEEHRLTHRSTNSNTPPTSKNDRTPNDQNWPAGSTT